MRGRLRVDAEEHGRDPGVGEQGGVRPEGLAPVVWGPAGHVGHHGAQGGCDPAGRVAVEGPAFQAHDDGGAEAGLCGDDRVEDGA
jgi:hypothetical protein